MFQDSKILQTIIHSLRLRSPYNIGAATLSLLLSGKLYGRVHEIIRKNGGRQKEFIYLSICPFIC